MQHEPSWTISSSTCNFVNRLHVFKHSKRKIYQINCAKRCQTMSAFTVAHRGNEYAPESGQVLILCYLHAVFVKCVSCLMLY